MFVPLGAAVSCAFLVGIYLAFVLAIRRPLSAHLGVEERSLRVGQYVYAGMVPMMLLSGSLIDHWGDKQMLFVGLLLSAAGFAALALCRTPRSVIIPLLIVGAAGAWVIIATTLMLPGVFFPSHSVQAPAVSAAGILAGTIGQGAIVQSTLLARAGELAPRFETPTAALNFGFVFVALGTLLAPWLFDTFSRRYSFKQVLLTAGLLCLLPAAFVGLMPADVFPRTHPEADFDRLLTNPRTWIAAAILVLYLPLERSLATWVDRYLRELHYDDTQIPRFLIAFWILFVAARLLSTFIVQPGFEMWFVFLLVVAAAATLGNLVGYAGSSRGGRGLLLIGACFGPILPTVLSVFLVTFPHAPATMLGLVFGLGFLSNAIFQPALVAFARNHSIRATVKIPMVMALLLAAPTMMLALVWG
jgi:fucose permease